MPHRLKRTVYFPKLAMALFALSAALLMSGCSFPISPLMFMVDGEGNQISVPDTNLFAAK